MKKKIITTLILTCSVFSLSAENTANDKKAIKLYKEAITFEKNGDVLSAIEKLKSATALSPNFTQAKNLHIKLHRNKSKLLYAQKVSKLNKVMIKEVDFDDDSLETALEKLKLQIQDYNEVNKTSSNSNFVVLDKNKEFQKYKLRLNLRNVPLKVVLDNMMSLIQGSYKVEKYAIKISSNRG